MMRKVRLGVTLFQLGGPDSLEAVEPFLINLFSDPDIMDIPLGRAFRKPLACLIARMRAAKVREYYRRIGESSPVRDLTLRQAAALESALSGDYDCKVVTAMRYWTPFTHTAIDQLEAFAPEQVILLPLYPQYSRATTGSSFNEWNRQMAGRSLSCNEKRVQSFHLHPRYLDAVIEKIRTGLEQFDAGKRSGVHLLFSAHGVPVKYVQSGDPFSKQTYETVHAVINKGGFENPFSLAFQSRIGPRKWTRPFVQDEINNLAKEGTSALLIVPVSFVSDHLETLHELGIKMREIAAGAGIIDYHVTPALNDSSEFIDALKSLVVEITERHEEVD